jgi:predicted NBD/HSP70 family sugar kinase
VQGGQGVREVTGAGSVVALDLGGTHVSAATVDVGSASVVPASRVREELPAGAGRDDLLGRIRAAAIAALSGQVEAAGVAVPGPFDYERGICLVEHKLESLYRVDLRAEVASALSLPLHTVGFLNDAEAFLLGEWWAGAARGHDRAVGITIGTGLGSAFLEHGSIVRTGGRVPPGGELYRVPFRNAPVEERISRRALLARYDADGVEVVEVARRARAGEQRARDAFDALSTDLADFLGPWLATFAPSCLVVGGSIARSWDLLEHGLSALEADLAVLTPAEHIDDAALLGAARHVVAEGAA